MPEAKTSIALLSQAGESGRHLRDALVGSGAPIVYEAQAAELDRDALEKSGARVVVVNLDTEVEAHLDEVYSLLGDDRYNVIFNEAQVSSQLSGWEQARWARHLAAKILGAENVDPPRPEGAEPVPQRAPAAADSVAEDVVSARVAPPAEEPSTIDEPVVASAAAAQDLASDAAPAHEDEREASDFDDFSDIASLLDELEPEPVDVVQTALPSAPPGDVGLQETVPMPVLDLSEFDLELAPEADTGRSDDLHAPLDVAEATRKMPVFDPPADGEDDASDGESLGFADLDDFAGGGDALDFALIDEPVAAAASHASSLDSELAEAANAGDAAAAGDVAELQMLDLDWADTPSAPAAEAPKEIVEDVPAPAIGSAFVWSLEDIDEGGDAASSTDSGKPAQPREFGIETISPTEYLSPQVDEVVEEPFDTGLSLELIPLDEAIAPQPGGVAASDHDGRETWLDISNKPVVGNVWVLGASIGGPEAVREFLAEMPAKVPALFLLAQHMGAEFMEIMSQQLARVTVLNVRTPSHGERVGHGDVVIVPSTHRLRVDREGVVTLEAIKPGSLPNAPSIDQVISDVAERFATRAGAIVFSGMADDAAEGARTLAEKGGKVYVQDPESCVISSMVDGVMETGVVKFAGSPKALAEKVLGDLKAVDKRNA